MLKSGVDVVPDFEVPAVDRNRTSPFPFGGHRFEFRAAGSSQNVSMVNTVLATIVAESFKDFSDQIEGGKKPEDVAKDALNKHWRVIFDGNGYDPAWLEEANRRIVKMSMEVEMLRARCEKVGPFSGRISRE